MTTFQELNGTKKVTIKKGKDGFGDVIYRATLTQKFNNGFEVEERFIEMKWFETEKKAIKWAENKLN
jgi:hypothetical protein